VRNAKGVEIPRSSLRRPECVFLRRRERVTVWIYPGDTRPIFGNQIPLVLLVVCAREICVPLLKAKAQEEKPTKKQMMIFLDTNVFF
jgi:hypothetical protein